MQEERLHLVDTARSNENEVEDSKESQLESEGPVSSLPECKSAEQCCKDVKNDFVPHIIL